MLSGETAIGAYPLEAVATMRQVICATETHFQSQTGRSTTEPHVSVPEAMSTVIPILCRSLPITKIVAITRSGYAARMIAVHRLRQPILAVSDDVAAARCFNLIAGTYGIFSEVSFSKTSTDHMMQVLKMLLEKGHVAKSDVVLITGVCYPTPGSRMNTVQIHNIGDLCSVYNWSDDAK